MTIAIVGKYTGLKDAYKSLTEALVHGGIANRVKVKLDWIEVRSLRTGRPGPPSRRRRRHSGAGRLSASAVRKAKILAAKFARDAKGVPYFGICFGMQMACIEAARNLAGYQQSASSTEFGETSEPVVGMMTEWMRGNELEERRARW